MLRIAVDVDGVLFERATYPELGKVNYDILTACKDLQKHGHKVYMYTGRQGKGLEVLQERLNEVGFSFDPYDHPNTNKIRADFYVDDRNIQPSAFPRIVEGFLFGITIADRWEAE